MSDIETHLHQITEAETLEEVWGLHVACMAQYGFDRLIYGYSRHMTETSIGDIRDAVVLSNYDDAYMRGYVGRGLYRDSPMVHWARQNCGAIGWGALQEWCARDRLTPEQRAVVAFNRAHGVLAGYTISFKHVSSRFAGAIGLCARAGLSQEKLDRFWRRKGQTIIMLNNVTHLKITQMPNADGRRLTRRQREVLAWVADGKTTQDVAAILNVTPATVEKHLRGARDALDAETTAQAILKAALDQKVFVFTDTDRRTSRHRDKPTENRTWLDAP